MNNVELVATIIDTELDYTPKGLPILKLGLAGEVHLETGKRVKFYLSKYNVTAFGKLAESAVNAVGRHVHALGRLHLEQWQNQKTGDKNSKLGIVINTMKPLAHQEAFDLSSPDRNGTAVISPGFQRVTLAGAATRDPKVIITDKGLSITKVGMALDVGSRMVDGQWESNPPIFVNLTAFNNPRAESIVKGQPIVVEGRYTVDNWTGKDGQQRYAQGVTVESLLPLERYFEQHATPPAAAPERAEHAQPPRQATPAAVASTLDIDDEFPPEEDLPF